MGSKLSGRKKPKCKEESLKPTCRVCSNRQCAGYWEARLKRMGLGMDSGANRSQLTYGHMIEHFGEFEGKVVYSPPTGERLDQSEWQITVL